MARPASTAHPLSHPRGLRSPECCEAEATRHHRRTGLPFKSLIQTLTTPDLRAPFKRHLNPKNPIKIDCRAMPQLLERHPFAQGLVNVAELAEVVARDFFGRGEGEMEC